jgi:transposase InsO family protein
MPSSKIPRLEQSFLGEAVEDRKKLLSDRGSGRLARAFEEYLRMLAIRHIYCAPHHSQTNGKHGRARIWKHCPWRVHACNNVAIRFQTSSAAQSARVYCN